MNSQPFSYTPPDSWLVNELGADPAEPADPWGEPSGVIEFEYQGKEVALLIAVGSYWGYLLITVDGQPANLLPQLPNSHNQLNEPSGSKNFYEPERVQDDSESPEAVNATRWLRVHRAETSSDAIHKVRIEVWRSWGQTPIRAVAIDALPSEPLPSWPGLLLILIALGLLWLHPRQLTIRQWLLATLWGNPLSEFGRRQLGLSHLSWMARPLGYWLMVGSGGLLLIVGLWLEQWVLCLMGVAIIALTTIFSLLPWVSLLLLGLPFYFGVKLPLLPGRSFELVDVGLYGGLILLGLHGLLNAKRNGIPTRRARPPIWLGMTMAALIGWSLVSAFEANYADVALREWRTVFLAGGLLLILLIGIESGSIQPKSQDRRILLLAWLAGGTIIALIGLWQYANNSMLITAEGVYRVRALYGSPNNLALYLERTLAVTLALALFQSAWAMRWLLWGMAGIQLLALLLTFSKGALFLGIPTIFVVLTVATLLQPFERRALTWDNARSRRRILWSVGLFGLFALVVIAPFLGTERFQRLLDFSQGTSFLRLQLWRSSLQMAWDHLLLGVGPDNFLYAYRSDYLLPAAWQEPDLNHPHNWLLDWWTRLGIPGLLLGLLFWGVGLGKLLTRLLKNGSKKATFALLVGLLAAALGSLAHGLIDASFGLPDLMLVWVFIFWLSSPMLDSR
ncbi:MAG: O-antigen ligase family protein [Chloroflexota bacterium]